jgi:hypothetical protein
MMQKTEDRQPGGNPSSSSHPIKGILYSNQPGMVLLKYVLLLAIVFLALASLGSSARSLLGSNVYKKDFIQEYLLARAVLDGIDPYLPLPDLTLRVLGPLPNLVFQHPTPHPPPVAILSLPLGLLTYQQAAVAWFLFEISCIFLAAYLLLRWLRGPSGLMLTAFITLLVLGWSPVWVELTTGQLMTLLLVLLILAWQALRSGQAITGGLFLGCVVALKLMAWPIVIFLAFRKNWRAIGAAGVTVAAANLAAALLMGFDRAVYFYWKVGAIVSKLYRAYENNFSAWSIGWRLFDGTGSPIVFGVEAPPLLAAPAVARYISFALPLVLLGGGLTLALRAHTFDAAFGILVCVSILVNPVAWSHYLIMALIPLAIVGRRLFVLELPKGETYALLTLGLLLFIPRTELHRFMLLLTGQASVAGASSTVPFAVALLSLIPAMAVLGLLWLVWHLDRAYPEVAV